MKISRSSIIKGLFLLITLCFIGGCGGTFSKPSASGPGDTAYMATLEQDTSPEAQLLKQGNAAIKSGAYATAYHHYSEYLKNYQRGHYAPLAAIGMANALLSQNKAGELLTQNNYLRDFIRTQPQVFAYNSIIAEAYLRTGARLEAVNMMYVALGAATAPDEIAAGEARLETILGSLNQAEINAVMSRKALTNLPNNDLMFRLGKACIINAGNYVTGSQILTTFIQQYPSDRNVPQAEAILAAGTATPGRGSCIIGGLLPMSGKFAHFGQKTVRGVELALTRFQMLNPGIRVQLIVKDTGGTREQTIQAVQELAREGATAIIGPYEEVEVAAQTAQSLGIPILIISQKEGIEQVGDFVFKNFLTPQMQVNALANHAVNDLGYSDFAVLYPEENFGRVYAELFRTAVEARGGRLTSLMPYNPSTRADFSSEISGLRQQGTFQALFFPEGEKKTAMILPQIFYYDLGKRVKMLGTNLWHDEKLLRSTGSYMQNSIIVDGFAPESGNPNAVWFAAQFEQLYNEPPTFIDAISFDSTYLIIKAATMTGAGTRVNVRNNMAYMQLPESITGFTGFNAAGEAQRTLNLLTVQKGKFVYLNTGR